MPSSHLILCHPVLLLPSVFPSMRVFSSESVVLIRWPKYWSFSFSISPSSEYSWRITFRSFSFSISPSSEYSGWITFTIDWLDLLAVQGTLKSLRQHHNSKASILQSTTFLIVQLSHPYMTTVKTQRNQVKREVGGGIGMGNTCKSMADSCPCMTKTTTIL